MKVGDLVRNIHALYPAGMGIIIEVSKPQLKNPNACPYRVHWFDYGYGDGSRFEASWMRSTWIEKIDAAG
jgi:hypothetical protein